MPRPCCCRRVAGMPRCVLFKPCGVPAASLQEVTLQVDELEAICLTDFRGLYQAKAAAAMGVSRQTLGRIVESARRKVAEALTQGKALRIEGGKVSTAVARTIRCRDCRHEWPLRAGAVPPCKCPKCESRNVCCMGGPRSRKEGRRRQPQPVN